MERIRLEKEMEEMERDQERLMAQTDQQRRGLLRALKKVIFPSMLWQRGRGWDALIPMSITVYHFVH